MTTAAGVDVLSLGGTKNGLLFGQAVIVLNEDAVRCMAHLRKTSMQLGSKMRFLSVRFEALLGGDLWLRSAARSNATTQRLYEAVRELPGLEIRRPVQANQIFAVLPPAVTERLQKRFRFYTWASRPARSRERHDEVALFGPVEGVAAARPGRESPLPGRAVGRQCLWWDWRTLSSSVRRAGVPSTGAGSSVVGSTPPAAILSRVFRPAAPTVPKTV